MKRTYIATARKDKLLIVILAAVIVMFTVLALFLKDRKGLGLSTAELQAAYKNDMTKLVISEVMSNNNGVWVNANNEKSDYLEIYNGTDKDINLKGYGLSDRMTKVRWRFPEYVLAAKSYLVVSLSGVSDGVMTANFKLTSAGGETIILTDDGGHILDAVDTVSLGNGQVMMRQGDGSWAVCDSGTPGFENSDAGLQAYIASLQSTDADPVVINEYMPHNEGNFTLDDGQQPGFIEVRNTGSTAVNLASYRLSDSKSVPFKFELPNVMLDAGEVYAVYTGSADYGTSYTGFNMNGGTGDVVLSRNGKIVQSLSYDGLHNGSAYVRSDQGVYSVTAAVSPGYPNDADGITAFQQRYLANPKGLIINEVMNDNTKYLAQNGTNYYDWVELRNNSSAALDLSKYYLTNDKNVPTRYQLPAVTLQPGEYYVIMCSGNTALTNNSYHHAGFKLGDNEGLYLTDGSRIVDSVYVSDVPLNYSLGRGDDSGWLYMAEPTPGQANGGGYRAVATAPQFGTTGGVYNSVANVTVEIKGNGTIYYTLDGSKPTSRSRVYSGPLVLSKTSVVKAVCLQKGMVASPLVCDSYIINEDHTLPVVSVSLDPDDLSYLNSHAGVRGIEEAAYAEMYEDGGSFSIPCSISCFGGNARYLPKKSYTLRFDRRWGASELDYQVFKNRDCSVYDALVLRSGSTDYYDSIFRDVLGTSLVDDYTDIDVQAYKTVIVYLNGRYWGIYNIREKVNSHFVMDHYNVSQGSIDLARIDGQVRYGSYDGYRQLRAYARTHDMSVAANYEYMQSQINMSALADYWIAETYVNNNDMLNNRFFRSPEYDDGRWHYVFYDLDYGWYNSGVNYYTQYLTSSRGLGLPGSYVYENDIIKALFSSKTFRQLWIERLTYNMHNTWKKANVLARIDQLEALYQPEMKRNQQRWGLSYDHWEDSVQALREYVSARDKSLRSQTKSFFGLTDAQVSAIFDD